MMTVERLAVPRGVSGWLLPEREGLGRRLGYALLTLPLGLLYAALLVGLGAAVATSVFGVGLLAVPVVLAAIRGVGGWERRLTRRMLGVEVEDVVRVRALPGKVARLRALVFSGGTWRTVGWLLTRCLAALGLATTIGVGILAMEGIDRVTVALVSLPLLVAVALIVVRLMDLHVSVMAAVAPRLLGPSEGERLELLRRSSVRLAERTTVARDLHDTIGHSLTASLLQAGAARKSLGGDDPAAPIDPTFARQALQHIEDTTRTALAELDRVLAVLEDRDAPTTVAVGDPGLADVEGLVAGLRDGGLPVTLALHVAPDDVPVPLGRLAYRVVQEGTTNVLRHAGRVSTVVSVHRQRDDLVVAVRSGTPERREVRPGPGGGRGITGLQERAATLGGRVRADRRADGGFELTATLPLGAVHG